MAKHGFKVSKSLNLHPQDGAPSNPVDGDVYYDANAKSFAFYHDGAWSFMNSIWSVTGSSDMTSSLFTPTVVRNSVIRVKDTNGAIHGMAASSPGKRITLYNATNGPIVIRHNSTGEFTANNRILTSIASNMTLVAGEVADFMYDGVQNRWVLVSVGSGAGAYQLSSTTYPGIVYVSAPPYGTPQVPVVDTNKQVIGSGLTRGTLGTGFISIGSGLTDSSVQIGRLGAPVRLAGELTSYSTTNTFNNDVVIGGWARVAEKLYANGGVDRETSAPLQLGTTNASFITIGRSGVTTNIQGPVYVGSLTSTGEIAFASPVSRTKMLWAGSGWIDTATQDFVPIEGPIAATSPSEGYIKKSWSNAAGFEFVVQLELPIGATITGVDILLQVSSGTVNLGSGTPRSQIEVVSDDLVVSRAYLSYTSQGSTSGLYAWKNSTNPSALITVPNGYTAFLRLGATTSGSGEIRIRQVRVRYTHTTITPAG